MADFIAGKLLLSRAYVLFKPARDFKKFSDQSHQLFLTTLPFYKSVSADNWMPQISIPTLIINAENDPLIGQESYPLRLAESKSEIILEMPKRGGHTGFMVPDQEFTWAEYRFLDFFSGNR